METQEIIEGNKLIAKFMGAIFHKDWTSVIYKTPQDTYEYITHPTPVSSKFWIAEEMSYHSSWDWLMPVVLKINTMDNFDYSVKIFTMDCQIENSKGEIIARCECKYNPDELINSVWEAVVEFIKWYNQNN